MSKALYLEDSYLKECDAVVESVKDGKYVVLDQTVFYPRGGGQPSDTGKIVLPDGFEFRVVSVAKEGGQILHEVDKSGLSEGNSVHCALDWEFRHRLMRMHTAAHVLAATMNKELGVLITGNQLGDEKTRFDFNMEEFDRGKFDPVIQAANETLKKDLDLRIFTLDRDAAMSIEGVVKLANALPPQIKRLRIVEIPGVDIQADGGTHVRNLKEVGQIELLRLENKGKSNRRIYFGLKP